jgi:hypothetical protein
MRLHSTRFCIVIFAIAGAFAGQLCAEQLNCAQVHAMAQMARARSISELQSLRTSGGESYRAQLVFTFRALELEPTEHTASAVLDFLPQNESHREEWYSLSGWICEQEQERDVTSLAKLQARMSHDFQTSVILVPKKMNEYVSYPVIMGLDPHDDYAERMTAVCKRHHREFTAAVNQLPEKDREWFLRIVFEPAGCRALAHPEAD